MSGLRIGRENTNYLLSSKISNIFQLLVSVISHCSQTFSADFLEILLKRRLLKNLLTSANKFVKNKKFNIMMKNKFDSSIDSLTNFY